MNTPTLDEQFGLIDIYLFDQLLKGNIPAEMTVLDAGCGFGRNLVYFLREGYTVFAVDQSAECVEHVRAMAKQFAPGQPETNFRVERVEEMSFADGCADVVISNTVLHLAANDAQFVAMLQGTWRVLKPGGLLFCRLASTIGMEGEFVSLGGRRYRSPDGDERYLVDAVMLHELTDRLGGTMVEEIKTTVVERKRAMSTWVVKKGW